MNQVIDSFSGEWRPLSNFWYAPVMLDGITYATNEHAFQAAKTLDVSERVRILNAATPGIAKSLGRACTLRPDWEARKIEVMTDLNRQKYKNPELRSLLLSTGDASLIEGNHWGDTFWGVCNGVGKNYLGKILMSIRDECKEV
jgi:ribA/ribD-fused uncharacterized protein